VIHVYALTDREGPRVELAGIDDSPVRLVRAERAAAAVSEHPGPPRPSAEALWRHEQVVEALLEERSLLPVRFGTGLASEAELQPLLHDPDLPTRLDAVRGCVEVSVRVVAPEIAAARVPQNGADSGRDHLRRLAERRAVTERDRLSAGPHLTAVAERLDSVTRGIAERPADGRVLLHLACLVERGRRAGVEQAVAELAEQLVSVRLAILCTGPWPPYNFVDRAPAAGGART
jgi:hypothetical protein